MTENCRLTSKCSLINQMPFAGLVVRKFIAVMKSRPRANTVLFRGFRLDPLKKNERWTLQVVVNNHIDFYLNESCTIKNLKLRTTGEIQSLTVTLPHTSQTLTGLLEQIFHYGLILNRYFSF